MRVLLIGDSIRLFYQNEVIKQLGEEYEVLAPQENCKFSAYVLNFLRFWLKDFSAPDIIHFNAGLWDTAILYREDGCFCKMNEYIKNMKAILRELKKTGAKLIFSTTTPVSEEKKWLPGPLPPAHKNADIIRYNKAACEAFKDEDIIINDLFSLMWPKKENFLSDDMIHPNTDGVKLLGGAVADCIKKCGNYKNAKCAVSSEHFAHKDEKTIQ